MTTRHEQVKADTFFGFLDSNHASSQVFQPKLISNEDSDSMVRAIREELRRSHRFTFSVAFVTPSAIALLKQALVDFEGTGVIITSTYLGFNSPAAFRELLNLPKTDVFLHSLKRDFHSKGYVFEQAGNTTAIIGSSNLTENALVRSQEWNLRFSAMPDGDIVQQLQRAIDTQLNESLPITHEWINSYEHEWINRYDQRHPPIPPDSGNGTLPPIQANEMQREALEAIQSVRDTDESRAVVISATGTGKTILAALDVRAVKPKRMLFIVHREQILDRAIEEFQLVLDAPITDFGKFVGVQRQIDKRYVFATIQSISKPDTLNMLASDSFDYVLIDEVHRAGAESYRRVIDHLQPNFLLGLTATPERTDGFNVYELFDFNVPYEIRLQKALESNMLVPFHYYGITDYGTEEGLVSADERKLEQLVSPERIQHFIDNISLYGHAGAPVRGLIFCSRKDEARELEALLNTRQVHGNRLRTVSLTGDDTVQFREQAVERLENGELDYLITVDVFNEGIDIPSVNQVVMLRQTQSSIIFTQQLGRGLRKAVGKDHLIVIDFIGNYTNNFLIPIALFGDNSLNKDSLRRNIIEADDAGVISGLSSVNFDKVSKQRIFDAIGKSKLDSMVNLKRVFQEMEHRLGHSPRLFDFARFDTADPVVIATKHKNYWRFLNKIKKMESQPTLAEDRALRFFSRELLNGKRPHELLLIQELLQSRSVSVYQFRKLLERKDLTHDDAVLASVARILDLSFFKEQDLAQYGKVPTVTETDGVFYINSWLFEQYKRSELFSQHIDDIVRTGLFISRHRYQYNSDLIVGERYSRKDVCRLLNWEGNDQATIFGYKVDFVSNSCPIFITYHKQDDVSLSTRYEDEFVDESTLKWFTRSRRTLASKEVKAIVNNDLPLHLFAKKDDAEGVDFFYLGQATSSNAQQTQMSGNKGRALDVVTMSLNLEQSLDHGLYQYLATPSAKD